MTQGSFTSLVDMQQKSCNAYADQPLFGVKAGEEWTWTSFEEFDEAIANVRAGLHELGISSGDNVAMIADNSVEWAVAAYATYSLRARFVPMYEVQLPKDWKYILNDCGAKVVITANEQIYNKILEMKDELPELDHVICLTLPASSDDSWEALVASGKANPIPPKLPERSDLAGLIYTSGTTGKPKGVMLSHGNIVSNINAVHSVFPMDEADCSLSFLPWAHSFGQTAELHCMMSMGASIALAESVDKLVDNLGEVKPTILFSVPRIFNRIYDGLQKRMADESAITRFMFERGIKVAEKKRELEEQGKSSPWVDMQFAFFDRVVFSKVRERFGGRLKYAFSGGAALSSEVAKFIDNMGITVFEGYGLTETSPIATANYPNNRKIGTIGKPIPGVEIYVIDEDGNKLPPNTEGEIVVVGPNIMQGYYNLEDKTEAVIFEIDGKRAFRTGDMGQIGSDGFVRITGRVKEQYKLENGKYVVPSPLEEQLQLSGFISQICIYGHNRPFNIGLVVPDVEAVKKWADEEGIPVETAEDMVDNDAVKQKLLEEIKKYGAEFKGYERPKRLVIIPDEFTTENDMLTPSLKLKRRNVLKAYEDEINAVYEDN
jgi:long-chain acyl-CoA synthetase